MGVDIIGEGADRLVTKLDAAGATTLGSAAVSNDAGVSNTYGSWVQVVASTSAESYVTEFAATIPGVNTPAVTHAPFTIELGLGGAGSEVVKYERIVPLTTFTVGHAYLVRLDFPLHVTAGRRLAARIKSPSSATVDLSVTLYGVPVSQMAGN